LLKKYRDQPAGQDAANAKLPACKTPAATDELRRNLAVKIVKNPKDRTVRRRHQRECQVLGSSQIPADVRADRLG